MYETAAIAGVEPFNYSHRQLVWMAKARQWDAWDRVSLLAVAIGSPYSKRPLKVEDFHPFRREEAKAQAREFQDILKREHARLPKKLTEDEKAAFFEQLFEGI